MDVRAVIEGIQPLAGQVVPVKTVQETQAPEEFADAYTAEVNVRCASKVIKVLDSKFNRDPSLGHLRRFSRHSQLPGHLRSAIEHSAHTIFVLIPPPIPDLGLLKSLLSPYAPATARQPENTPTEEPSSSENAANKKGPPPLHSLRIPLQPPLNPKQAEKWTKSMWPVIFNPAAPRASIAPPPQILNRTLELTQPRAGYYLSLAQGLANEAEQSGLGRPVGAVVVDPAIEETLPESENGTPWMQAVIAAAGDARYSRNAGVELGSGPNPVSATYNADLEGGPELHALMRAVDMVARRRRENDERHADAASSPDNAYLSPLEAHFLYQTDAPPTTSTTSKRTEDNDISPVPGKYQRTDTNAAQSTKSETPAATTTTTTTLERTSISSTSRIRPRALGGYLCTDMDIYLTREPCLCCSMGMLLSRFRAVIFPRRGRMVTGGLASEPVVKPTAAEDGNGDEKDVEEETEGKDKSRDPRNNRKYYGLHWRKELNWRALGFEFVEDGYDPEEQGVEGEDGVAFHA